MIRGRDMKGPPGASHDARLAPATSGSEPSGAVSIPRAVVEAAERVRRDASDTMRHDTTSDLKPRLMCRVAVADLGLVLAWLDQHQGGGA